MLSTRQGVGRPDPADYLIIALKKVLALSKKSRSDTRLEASVALLAEMEPHIADLLSGLKEQVSEKQLGMSSLVPFLGKVQLVPFLEEVHQRSRTLLGQPALHPMKAAKELNYIEYCLLNLVGQVRLLDKSPRPVLEILWVLGFREDNGSGIYRKIYGGREYSAGRNTFGWEIYGGGEVTPDIFRLDIDFRISNGDKIKPYDLMILLYGNLGRDFGGVNQPPLPWDLQIGKGCWEHQFDDHKEEMARRQIVRAEASFFRFCLNYLRYPVEDFDFPLELCFSRNQIRLSTPRNIVYCPASGKWNTGVRTSGKEFFRVLPRRFRSSVSLEISDGWLDVGGSRLRANTPSHLVPH